MTPIFHIDPPAVADPGDELAIQVAIRKALKARAPGVALIAVPNGAQRTAWAAIKAKQEGMQAGFPDCIVIGDDERIAFLEIKTRTGTLSDQQHIWLNYLTKAGFNCGVFRSVETAIRALQSWGFPIADKGALAA